MVKAVCALYAAPTFQIRDLYSVSEPQPQGRGVRQGCPLSPYLFIAVLTVVMHDVDQEFLLTHGTLPWVFSAASPMWDMEYADYTIMMCRDP